MPERKVLLCPRCGAPLPPAATQEVVACAFCNTSSMPAPKSEGKTAPPAIDIATTPARASPHACPRCEELLFEGRTQDVTLLGCGTCGGIWLDNANAQRAIRNLDDKISNLSHRAASRATASPSKEKPAACPVCRLVMGRVRRTLAQIDLDVCPTHGTWFDRDELAIVMNALRLPPPRHPPVDIPLDASIDEEVAAFKAGTLTPDTESLGRVAGGVFAILGALASSRKN